MEYEKKNRKQSKERNRRVKPVVVHHPEEDDGTDGKIPANITKDNRTTERREKELT